MSTAKRWKGGLPGRPPIRARRETSTDSVVFAIRSRKEVGNYGSERWAQLDHRFHLALAESCRNERLLHSARLLLTECFYVFYLYPARQGRPAPAHDDAVAYMAGIAKDHRRLVDLVAAGDGDEAEREARSHMRKSGRRAERAIIDQDLGIA